MEDINVKDIEALKLYKSKLGEFNNGCTAIGALIDVQIRRIKEDLNRRLNSSRNIFRKAEDDAKGVIRRYETALSRCENARHYIGETDLECKQKIQEAKIVQEQIESQIQRLRIELENTGLQTKNFCLQVCNMVDSCQSHLDTNIMGIEQYKEQK